MFSESEWDQRLMNVLCDANKEDRNKHDFILKEEGKEIVGSVNLELIPMSLISDDIAALL